ncbi:hypothetical protein FACS1894187_23050 [Synergistales bacterium]|nr:hypothetical protein FACS1894187_23050 [Synergistales bacterium]
MIKMLSSATMEIDFPDDAVAEILKPLDLENGLLKNSVGIISCHCDYIENGTVKDLCDKLTFDVVGYTTAAGATGDFYGQESLSLAILTSDDVRFNTVMSEPILAATVEKSVDDAYKNAAAECSEKPKLVLAFLPFLLDISGAVMMEGLSKIAGDVPVFGTAACSHKLDNSIAYTIRNGSTTHNTAVFVALEGNVNPKFFFTSIADSNINDVGGEVTESEECFLKKVNGVPFIDFVESCGISSDAVRTAPASLPLMIDRLDGSQPTVSGIYDVTPDGCAHCGCYVPMGARLSFGRQDYSGILQTAETTVKRALRAQAMKTDKSGAILIFSCISRFLMLGAQLEDEMEKIAELVDYKVPYQFGYSGGEICPVYDEKGAVFNRFHNFSCAACVL